jgi:phosphoribosylformylglycinamidine synthase
VLGICNGFQVLTECHLLPGILRMNTCGHFVCQNQYIRPATWQSPLTHALADRPYKIPIAHAEGNFYCDDEELRRLEDEERILFRYCDSEGRRSTGSNPNGSVADIAGICNAGRNVLGLMPHPERAADPLLRNTDGAALLDALRTGVAWGSYVA